MAQIVKFLVGYGMIVMPYIWQEAAILLQQPMALVTTMIVRLLQGLSEILLEILLNVYKFDGQYVILCYSNLDFAPAAPYDGTGQNFSTIPGTQVILEFHNFNPDKYKCAWFPSVHFPASTYSLVLRLAVYIHQVLLFLLGQVMLFSVSDKAGKLDVFFLDG